MRLEILGSGCANCQKLMAVTEAADGGCPVRQVGKREESHVHETARKEA